MPLRVHLSVSLVLLVLSFGPGARGAEVQVRADDACAEPGPIVDEVEQIIGRPLASIPGVAFQVEITHAGLRTWRLRLDTEDTDHAAPSGGSADAAASTGAPPRATRELTGASCGELASAAAVAIALSIQNAEAEKSSPAAPEPPPTAPEAPAAVAVRPAVDVAPPPLRVSAALLAVGDSGALPHVAAGGELNVALQRGRFGAVALVSGFPPQQTSVTPLTGGQFTLVFGGLLACANRPRTSATAQICAGGELGPNRRRGDRRHTPSGGRGVVGGRAGGGGGGRSHQSDWGVRGPGGGRIPLRAPHFPDQRDAPGVPTGDRIGTPRRRAAAGVLS